MKLQNVIAFTDFYTTIADRKISITLAYKLNKIIESLGKDYEFYQKELLKIFNDCVEKENGQFKMTEDKQNFMLLDGKSDEFEKRFKELRNIDVEFDDNMKVDISLFEDLEITPIQLAQIQDFLK